MLLLTCSPGDRIAGAKGGSETTNGVTACIYHDGGAPAVGSIVHLRSADYVSRSDALVTSSTHLTSRDNVDVLTDSQGRFTIADIVPGDYYIEINDTATTAGRGEAVRLTCIIDTCSDTVDLGTDSLRPYATITGMVDTAGSNGRQLYAQVRGLERLAKVSAAGSFTFHDLPAGCMDVRIVDDAPNGTAREVVNVSISPGDTVKVMVRGTSAFSEYIYLNTTVTGAAVSGIITGFPLLVRLDSSSFDFSRVGPPENGIRFTNEKGAPLSCEIEHWDAAAQNAAIWVKLDTIRGNNSEQYIVMQWGDNDVVSRSDGTAVFDTALGFAGVWHLNENPESGTDAIKDRTANGYNGTPNGSMTGGNVASGMIGTALMFDGYDDYIDAGKLNIIGNYTLSCWINAGDLDSASRFIWKEFSYTLWYDAEGDGVRVEHFTDSLVWRGIYQDNSRLHPLNTDTWYYLAGTFDGDKIRLYVNGEQVDSTQTIGVNPLSSQEPLSLGGRSGEFVKGIMDEVRIERRARSADWIRLCYRNQKQNAVVTGFKH
jgi:hypothetical protein